MKEDLIFRMRDDHPGIDQSVLDRHFGGRNWYCAAKTPGDDGVWTIVIRERPKVPKTRIGRVVDFVTAPVRWLLR